MIIKFYRYLTNIYRVFIEINSTLKLVDHDACAMIEIRSLTHKIKWSLFGRKANLIRAYIYA